ncbi:MAG: RlmE family RNA methyltransferase [Spirochaetales bacterium]|nr:RlmE family RNA methyltransferase [Spirochaetales bacterium]
MAGNRGKAKGKSSGNRGGGTGNGKSGNQTAKTKGNQPSRNKTGGANSRAQADHYTLRAQKEGYPARSVYKLEEIQDKYHVFPSSGKILDIGAAPGSWSLFILRKLNGRGTLSAIDLKPLNLPEIPDNYFFIQGDFFDAENVKALKERGPYDAVVSDAAPDTTGNRTLDTGRSAALIESILYQSRELLKKGGSLTVKIFQGGEEQNLLAAFRENFKSARMFKPKACRKDSFETFLIGTGFKGLTDERTEENENSDGQNYPH